MSETTTTPVRFRAGDYANVECVNGAGVRPHIYVPEEGWQCSHCGGFTNPPEVVPLRPQPAEQKWTAPTQPKAVRVRLMSGESSTLPLASAYGFEVVVRPFVGEGPIVAHAAHEVAEIKFLYERKS